MLCRDLVASFPCITPTQVQMVVWIYSGLDDAGSLLATIALPPSANFNVAGAFEAWPIWMCHFHWDRRCTWLDSDHQGPEPRPFSEKCRGRLYSKAMWSMPMADP